MHSISIQRGELGKLVGVVLDPASVDFLLPYQHQSEAKPWYGVENWKLVSVSHDLLSSVFLRLLLTAKSSKKLRVGGFLEQNG
jgi:hypothetical protein